MVVMVLVIVPIPPFPTKGQPGALRHNVCQCLGVSEPRDAVGVFHHSADPCLHG